MDSVSSNINICDWKKICQHVIESYWEKRGEGQDKIILNLIYTNLNSLLNISNNTSNNYTSLSVKTRKVFLSRNYFIFLHSFALLLYFLWLFLFNMLFFFSRSLFITLLSSLFVKAMNWVKLFLCSFFEGFYLLFRWFVKELDSFINLFDCIVYFIDC